jgi:hypothetical protein
MTSNTEYCNGFYVFSRASFVNSHDISKDGNTVKTAFASTKIKFLRKITPLQILAVCLQKMPNLGSFLSEISELLIGEN